MKILRLTIKDFLGIKEAVISPGKITVLAGENGQGKSTVLKALQALFKGAPLTVIHRGTERAEIIAELEDLRISRVWTHKTTSVSVKDSRNFVRPAPQEYLNGIVGNGAFNPMAFLLSDSKKRREILLKAMATTATKAEIEADAGEPLPLPDSGPALEMYADAHKIFYTRRTEVNRRAKAKRAAAEEVLTKLPEGYQPVEGIEATAEATRMLIADQEAEIAGLEADKKASERAKETRAKLTDRIAKNERIAADGRKELDGMKEPDIETLRQKVAQLQALLEEAQAVLDGAVRRVREITDLRTIVAEMERTVASDRDTLAALPGEFNGAILAAAEGDLSELRASANTTAEEIARQRIWNEHVVLRKEAEDAEEQAANLTFLVERFGSDLPAKALHEAKLPIAGLALSGDQVTVGEIPIDDLSTEEQMRITLSIARAMIPEDGVKTICIDGWERVDEKRQAEFIRQAEGDGFQYWMTRVGEPREGEIAIKEGRVA
ncbi:MAG TPA: AAA family ATPase [Thermodesulfobacteriota bacterium]|nr:AAA family ATPase [Thermodesulfobacteriota bacterium]